ncbi:Coiled-coil domain-containing protein 175 [Stylophora pistillata]|uniref:Coiled-coil domain-containing protein 175 n=2 Tax=Stylophora pistillata TaxID=50429 RepID=A0A2B4RWQ4_STYPI|nr:Coiled-coil domain-containing protein 175 [Stylophora pistillata]
MLKRRSQSTEITPLVNSAVEKLQELGHHVKTRRESGEPVDTSGVDVVVKALKDLEEERVKLHELLETETITASVLRYKLKYFPSDIKSEIQDAVYSARQSNEAEIMRLKTQLNTIITNIKSLQDKHEELVKENAKLEPERNDMQTGHDEIIALLNQKMADKASKQITLNETRDNLRETYKRIIDLEDSIVQLKEDLVHEREEARLEKEKLKQSVADTLKKAEEQRKTNIEKRNEIDKLQEELVDSESVLDSKRKSIRKFETSRNRLEAQEVQLNRHLQKEIKDNSILTQEGMKIVKEHNEMAEGLEERKKSLQDQLEMIQNKVKEAEEQDKQLTVEKKSLENGYKIAMELQEKDAEVVRHHERVLARLKESLQYQNHRCAKVRAENMELEEEINQLEESHKQVLQTKRDNFTKESNEFKGEYGRYMATMSKKVTEGKAEHARLTESGTQLQKDLKKDEADIISKQKQLKKAKHDYTTLQKQLKTQLKALQESIDKLEKDRDKKKDVIQDKTPVFKDLEVQFKERTQEFDTTKKKIVDLKNKKASMETSVQRAQRDVEKLAEPQTRLHGKLKERRVEALEQLKNQSEDVKKIETEIFSSSQRLGAVLKENHRQLVAEIETTRKAMIANSGTREILQKQLLEYRGTLHERWREDFNLDKIYAERDSLMLEDIERLQEETSVREERIDEIHQQLEEQLSVLSHFIDGVANLRPKGGKKIKPGRPLHGSPPLSPKPPPRSPTRRKSTSDVSAPAESDL